MNASTEPTTPTAEDVADALCDALNDPGTLAEFDDAFEGARARSFAGAVLKLSNGAEFQITVVQSRRAAEAQ